MAGAADVVSADMNQFRLDGVAVAQSTFIHETGGFTSPGQSAALTNWIAGPPRLRLDKRRDLTGTFMGVIFLSHSSRNNDEAVAGRDWLRATP